MPHDVIAPTLTLGYEHILALQVPVEDILAVDVKQSEYNLDKPKHDLFLCQGLFFRCALLQQADEGKTSRNHTRRCLFRLKLQ